MALCSASSGRSRRTRDYHDLYQVSEYLESFIRSDLLYDKVIIAVLYGRLASLSNQGSVSRFFSRRKNNFDNVKTKSWHH